MTRARELARLGNENVISVDSNNQIGIGSQTPDRRLDVGTGELVVGAAITLGGNSGIISATAFHGNLGGKISVTDSTASTSTSTGALIVSGGVGIAKSLFVGEGVSLAGTITYNDVTNIDSVGIVTAGKGFRATAGGLTMVGVATLGAVGASGTTIHVHGDGRITGVLTATAFYGDGQYLLNSGINTTSNVGFGTTRPDSIARVNNTTILNAGIVTAYKFYGDASEMTNAGPSLTGSTDNTIVTVTGSNAIAGEANLTFDGEDLVMKTGGEIRADAPDGGARFKVGWTENDEDAFLDLHDRNDVRHVHIDSEDAADNVSYIRRGRLGINTDSSINHPVKIDCNGTSGQDVWALHLNNTAGANRGRAGIVMGGQGNTNAYYGAIYGGPNADAAGHGDLTFVCPDNSGQPNTMLFLHGKSYSDGKIQATPGGGGFQILGALSKSSGSFRIPHPLSGLSTTKDLVHSFIEGPQADLIYRGVSTLSSGTSAVNIDTHSKMTDGTFVALVNNVSCFTSNETDWKAVKGSVTGNVLTISCEDNSSTAKVSWLVIGERCDAHMISTETVWTDDAGKVITEVNQDPPLK